MMHVAPISGVACSGGRFVATAGYDNQLILWNAKTHSPIARVYHDHLVNQCAFSSDGRYLASASSDYTARIWTLPAMRLVAVLTPHDDDVEMVAFAPDALRIATCSRDHRIRIFDLQGALLQTCVGHKADVISVSWSPSGDELISSSDDGTVRRWRASDGVELSHFALNNVETDTLVVTEDGVIIAGDDEGRLTVIDADGPVDSLSAHDAGIKRLVYSVGLQTLVSLSYDRTMRTWDVNGRTLTPAVSADLPLEIWPRSCAFLTESRVAFATFGSTYAEFDTATRHWSMSGYQPSRSINAVVQSEDGLLTIGDAGVVRLDNRPLRKVGSLCNFLVHCGSHLITGGQAGVVYDARTGATVYQHSSPLNCGCTFDVDGVPNCAIGTYTGEIIIVRASEVGLEFVRIIEMHQNAVKGLASDGVTIMGVSADCATALLAIDGFTIIALWENGHDRIANACCAIEAGLYASISRDMFLRLWDKNGVRHEIPAPHDNSLKCVAAKNGRIAVGDYGGHIAVYDLDSEKWTGVLRPTTWGISSIAASRDGDFVASSYDGNVYQLRLNLDSYSVSVAVPVEPNLGFSQSGHDSARSLASQ